MKIITFIIFSLVTFVFSVKAQKIWTQVGEDIDGQSTNANFGYSVCLNSDGLIVAIGAPYNSANSQGPNGYVSIYNNEDGVWNQIGQNILGSDISGNNFGRSISLSADGNIVAIGTPYSDENGWNSGQVQVYENTNGAWTQIGQNINGEAFGDYSGSSISLSADGSTVSIGAPRNEDAGDRAGHVRVFKYINEIWTQIGQDIDGESENDEIGKSVSLNSDGSFLALGTTGIGTANSHNNYVRIYKYENNKWSKIGKDIEPKNSSSLSINSDGSTVAIGIPGDNVCMYKNQNNTWTQIGQDIENHIYTWNDEFGYSVSLNSAGTIVAIGDINTDLNGTNAGHVSIYENQNDTWTQIGDDILGEGSYDNSGHSVSLSSDGSIVAIGAPYNNGNGSKAGHVRIYKRQKPAVIIKNQPDNQNNICINTTTYFSVTADNVESYQWQVSSYGGINFKNIEEDAIYSNSKTSTLIINAVTAEMNNYQYRCILKHSLGNVISNAAELTVNPIIICRTDTVIFLDQTDYYTVKGTEFDPIETNDNCGVASITNDYNNSSSLEGSQFSVGVTTVNWIITDDAGLVNSCSFDVTIGIKLGTQTIDPEEISIFPNPTHGVFNINFSDHKIQKLLISDITGKKIFEKSDVMQKEVIDLSGFHSGIYIISILSNKQMIIKKIVKK
nr:T9SS type A sorting domain-containing protein [uncultured Carboxylicivirga sp.]